MKKWFKQMVSAVDYIHENILIHRDLKRSFLSRYGSKTDVFSLVLIFADLCAVLTWAEREMIFDNYRRGIQSDVFGHPHTAEFIELLTQVDPDNRPPCKAILENPF
ncbi:hypothetical protein PENTCL1PPCAC_8569, partial [Pristionchus entomophagus]